MYSNMGYFLQFTRQVIFISLFMNLVFSMLFIATWAIFNNSAVKLFLARYFYFWIFLDAMYSNTSYF